MERKGHCKNRGLNFSIEKETKIINGPQEFFVHHRIVSAGKRVEFLSDRK